MYVYGLSSVPLAQVDKAPGVNGFDIEYLHTDLIGSVRAVTDRAGLVAGDSDYTIYGQPLQVGGTAQPGVGAVTRFGFAGEYTDDSGYQYLRARYYDPASGQFLTRDPLEDQTRQPYAYTSGNPLQYVDPLGLWDWPWEWELEDVSNVVASFGDTITFGGTKKVRQWLGVDDAVNYCSAQYGWGEKIAIGAEIGLGVTGIVKGAGKLLARKRAKQLANQHVTNSGETVLGSYPKYIEKAQERGASYFDIGKQRDDIVAAGDDPWIYNRKFLDGRIKAGDNVFTTTPKGAIRKDSYLDLETLYLQENGYRWINQWALRKVK